MPDLHTGGLRVDSGAARSRKGARAGQRVDRRGSYASARPEWKIQEVSRVGAQGVTSKSKLLAREMPDLHTGKCQLVMQGERQFCFAGPRAPLGCAWPAAAADAPHLRPHLLAARHRVVAPETGAGQRRGAFFWEILHGNNRFCFSKGNENWQTKPACMARVRLGAAAQGSIRAVRAPWL
eukprot:COSAG04_NODE_10017_length_812_cov_2.252454_1_plen_180_part_00